MRLDVKFVLPFSESKPVRFGGRGFVHLLETGMVFEGPCSDAFVPLISRPLRPLISRWQVRTVPYSLILRYAPPRLPFRMSYHVHFKNVDGKTFVIGFRLRRGRGSDQSQFAALLEAYRSACKLELMGPGESGGDGMDARHSKALAT